MKNHLLNCQFDNHLVDRIIIHYFETLLKRFIPRYFTHLSFISKIYQYLNYYSFKELFHCLISQKFMEFDLMSFHYLRTKDIQEINFINYEDLNLVNKQLVKFFQKT